MASEKAASIRSGLVSITFRQLDRPAIVKTAAAAGLRGIEWGGDVHVPSGDTKAAEEAARLTKEAGLKVAAYGSYYRCQPGDDFEPVLASAVALEAPLIRVWAGTKGSADLSPDARAKTVEEIRRISEVAGEQNVIVAAEWHGGTLTDTRESGAALAGEVNHDNFRLYWQPSRKITPEQRLAELKAILPWLAHLHVFHWLEAAEGADRRVLAEGESDWDQYFALAVTAPPMPGGLERYAMLEFVREDEPSQLAEDAAVLWRLLNPTP